MGTESAMQGRTKLTNWGRNMSTKKDKHVGTDDVAAGAAGAAVGAGIGVAVGHLGAAGLAIGGTAVAVPAIAVVGAPAVAVGAVAFVGWKVFKALKK